MSPKGVRIRTLRQRKRRSTSTESISPTAISRDPKRSASLSAFPSSADARASAGRATANTREASPRRATAVPPPDSDARLCPTCTPEALPFFASICYADLHAPAPRVKSVSAAGVRGAGEPRRSTARMDRVVTGHPRVPPPERNEILPLGEVAEYLRSGRGRFIGWRHRDRFRGSRPGGRLVQSRQMGGLMGFEACRALADWSSAVRACKRRADRQKDGLATRRGEL